MTKNSLEKLEQLIEAAPVPTNKPTEKEEAFQTEGDDPNTRLQNLTVDGLVESQIVRRHELANQITTDEIIRQRHLDDLRDVYVPKLYSMMIGWLGFVALYLVAVGLSLVTLADAVLVALITTTTATVLGIFVIVAKWLFPSQQK